MSTWVWLVVYLVGFALLQVLLYRYLRNSRGGQTAPRGPEPEGARAPVDGASSRRPDAAEDGVCCRNCGAHNEVGYAYCRECAGQL